MKRTLLLVSLFSSLFFAGIFTGTVSADPAPPSPPMGGNILSVDEITMVQMVAEEVLIDVGPGIETMINSWGDEVWGYQLAFHCQFWFENQGEQSEELTVRFPIYEFASDDDVRISIHSIKVNGVAVDWWEDDVPGGWGYVWAHFDVSFPPQEEVEIQIVYTSITQRYYHTDNHEVYYILRTGGGWYGPIEQGKIILRLPYRATEENVSLPASLPNAVFTDSDVYWDFTDLEPTEADNFIVWIMAPETWLAIEADREKLETSPNNTSALERLAKAIESVCISKGFLTGSPDLFEEGFEAAEKLVQLVPDSVDYHKLYMSYLIAGINPQRVEIIKQEQSFFQEADPENQSYINWIALELEYYQDYTAAETAASFSPTPTRTSTPVPSETLQPTITQEASTSTPTPKPRRATHTPEPALGAEQTPTAADQSEDDGRTGRIIAWAVLLVLMLVNFILGRIQKSKRK